MKAIQTAYKGYRFRSRLEARWAVFFDALGIKWEYEKEGYDLGFGELYLPDFFVHAIGRMAENSPGAGFWVEVKGQHPTPNELRRVALLYQATRHLGYLVYGAPGENPVACGGVVRDERSRGWLWVEDFVHCCSPRTGYSENKMPSVEDGWVVEKAVAASRAARFEFGEEG